MQATQIKQDPKTDLGLAAVLCNIGYFQAKKRQHSLAYKEARAEQRRWQARLRELEQEKQLCDTTSQ